MNTHLDVRLLALDLVQLCLIHPPLCAKETCTVTVIHHDEENMSTTGSLRVYAHARQCAENR